MNNDCAAMPDFTSAPNPEQNILQSDSTTKLFRCTLCHTGRTIVISEKNILKHHAEKHSNISFEADRYIFVKSTISKYFCVICKMVIDKLKFTQHHEQNHPMFQFYHDVIHILIVEVDAKTGEFKWPHNKDSTMVSCRRCCNRMSRDQFLEHFEDKHPNLLNWSRKQLNVNSNQREGNVDEDVNQIGSDVIPIEKETFASNMPMNVKNTEPMNNDRVPQSDFSITPNSNSSILKTVNIIKVFKCTLCGQSNIHEKSILKHHTKVHSNTSFEADKYIFDKCRVLKYQCVICKVVGDKFTLKDHREKNHPMFQFSDVLQALFVEFKPETGELKWPHSKDSTVGSCKRCYKKIQRDQFLEHFKDKHPALLNSTEEQSHADHNPEGSEEDPDDDVSHDDDEDVVPFQKEPLYKILVSHSELQRLLQQNRLDSHDGELILKDSA